MKGNIWKINVVGIRKSNKNADPIFWFPPKIKKPEPNVRHIIAPTNNIEDIWEGIPFEEIYSTVFSKPFILLGIAEINIEDIAILEMKSKKVLEFLYLKNINLIPTLHWFFILNYRLIHFFGSFQVSLYNQLKKVRKTTLPNTYIDANKGSYIFAIIIDIIKIIRPEIIKSIIGKSSVFIELIILLKNIYLY